MKLVLYLKDLLASLLLRIRFQAKESASELSTAAQEKAHDFKAAVSDTVHTAGEKTTDTFEHVKDSAAKVCVVIL